MSLSTGTKLGPYQIISPIGAGGMGEVYRARDARLERDVAIKLLPASFAQDADRLRRFEQEARAVGGINHPNILAVHDIGQHDGIPYLVSELLEGETLREHMGGTPLPQRKAIDYAIQIANGLAAAHEKGVIHRDLKPDNLFVLRDGRIKILDFGLAKLIRPESMSAAVMATGAPTLETPDSGSQTSPGQVMGTVGYMSPEQVRGKVADHRSDIFTFGAILYEMLSGQRAFKRDSGAETMTAILKEDPPELTETNRNISPALERIVRHCLEKAPEQRFQSARDIAFDLESLSSASSPGTTTRVLAATRVSQRRWRWAAIVFGLLAALALTFVAGRKTAPVAAGRYSQLTFQRGWIGNARFSADGELVTYTANWNGQGQRLYTGRARGMNWQQVSSEPLEITAISKEGEILVVRNIRGRLGFAYRGTLASIPSTGGNPKDILDDVQDADFSPTGSGMAVIHVVNSQYQLESPVGKVLYKPKAGYLSEPRFSPDGKHIAFFEHPIFGDARGLVVLVDLQGKARALTPEYANVNGSAWKSNDEFYFTASDSGISQAMFAVTLDGVLRVVQRVPGNLKLQDIDSKGRLLLSHETLRRAIYAYGANTQTPIDLAWFDWSQARGISPDGKTVLLEEEGEGGGPEYTVFLRNVNGDPPTRVGTGQARGLSNDMKWVGTLPVNDPHKVIYFPTGAGSPREYTIKDFEILNFKFFNDSKRIAMIGRTPNGNRRTYVTDIDGTPPKPLTDDGFTGVNLSPDDRQLVATGPEGNPVIIDLATGAKRDVPGWQNGEAVIGWSGSNDEIFVGHRPPDVPVPVLIYALNIKTGARRQLATLNADLAGLVALGSVQITPDGKNYCYSTLRQFSDLYIYETSK